MGNNKDLLFKQIRERRDKDSIDSCAKTIRHNEILITFVYLIRRLIYGVFLRTAITAVQGR